MSRDRRSRLQPPPEMSSLAPRIAVEPSTGTGSSHLCRSTSPCPDSCFTFSDADVESSSVTPASSHIGCLSASSALFKKRHFDFASIKAESDRSIDNDLEFLQVVIVPNSGGSLSTQNSSQSGFSPIVSSSMESTGNCLDGLATVRIQPDVEGKFGFHVKGGIDRGEAVTISRISTHSPADLCSPKLHVGDQVLYINGRDISSHTHEQVVQFIRSAAEKHSLELVLVVRQSMIHPAQEGIITLGGHSTDSCCSYRLMDPNLLSRSQRPSPTNSFKGRSSPSSWCDCIPEPPTQPTYGTTGNVLEDSILALQETLKNGQAMEQFERLYRHKRGLTTNTADLPLNASKNRYKDILPYDQTRVVLSDSPDGNECDNYINANYINMQITDTSVLNKYIASQGPLQSTCEQFWRMIWEQEVCLVVMLTDVTESGREKCYQYWPNQYEAKEFGPFVIHCGLVNRVESLFNRMNPSSPLSREQELYCSLLDSEDIGYTEREFTLTRKDSLDSRRRVVQLQYHSWVDYAPPINNEEFCNFVQRVRELRSGSDSPLLVHCSAGIGRTGVLITMETAFCLMDAEMPVFPLRLVQQMRDQRAMLVQTESQYRFVCEAIVRTFKQKKAAQSQMNS